jgi:hypothetical protein
MSTSPSISPDASDAVAWLSLRRFTEAILPLLSTISIDAIDALITDPVHGPIYHFFCSTTEALTIVQQRWVLAPTVKSLRQLLNQAAEFHPSLLSLQYYSPSVLAAECLTSYPELCVALIQHYPITDAQVERLVARAIRLGDFATARSLQVAHDSTTTTKDLFDMAYSCGDAKQVEYYYHQLDPEARDIDPWCYRGGRWIFQGLGLPDTRTLQQRMIGACYDDDLEYFQEMFEAASQVKAEERTEFSDLTMCFDTAVERGSVRCLTHMIKGASKDKVMGYTASTLGHMSATLPKPASYFSSNTKVYHDVYDWVHVVQPFCHTIKYNIEALEVMNTLIAEAWGGPRGGPSAWITINSHCIMAFRHHEIFCAVVNTLDRVQPEMFDYASMVGGITGRRCYQHLLSLVPESKRAKYIKKPTPRVGFL